MCANIVGFTKDLRAYLSYMHEKNAKEPDNQHLEKENYLENHKPKRRNPCIQPLPGVHQKHIRRHRSLCPRETHQHSTNSVQRC